MCAINYRLDSNRFWKKHPQSLLLLYEKRRLREVPRYFRSRHFSSSQCRCKRVVCALALQRVRLNTFSILLIQFFRIFPQPIDVSRHQHSI